MEEKQILHSGKDTFNESQEKKRAEQNTRKPKWRGKLEPIAWIHLWNPRSLLEEWRFHSSTSSSADVCWVPTTPSGAKAPETSATERADPAIQTPLEPQWGSQRFQGPRPRVLLPQDSWDTGCSGFCSAMSEHLRAVPVPAWHSQHRPGQVWRFKERIGACIAVCIPSWAPERSWSPRSKCQYHEKLLSAAQLGKRDMHSSSAFDLWLSLFFSQNFFGERVYIFKGLPCLLCTFSWSDVKRQLFFFNRYVGKSRPSE